HAFHSEWQWSSLGGQDYPDYLKTVQIKLELNQPLGIGEAFGVRRLWRRFGSPGSSITLSMKLASWKRLPQLRQSRSTPKGPPMSGYLIDLNRLLFAPASDYLIPGAHRISKRSMNL